MVTLTVLDRLTRARLQFESLRQGKEDLLRGLDESEIPEAVFHSNAIEGSTLTLDETERVLAGGKIDRPVSDREIEEAKNLGRVLQLICADHTEPLNLERIRTVHGMLLDQIDEPSAGRFRNERENGVAGRQTVPSSGQLDSLVKMMLVSFDGETGVAPVQRISGLLFEFERVHPFNTIDGLVARVLINQVLYRLGFPPIILRGQVKAKYYEVLSQYDVRKSQRQLDTTVAIAVAESLHRRLAHLRGNEIGDVAEVAQQRSIVPSVLMNQARRQLVPAFRERGVWKIPTDY
jgi:Fic family protein